MIESADVSRKEHLIKVSGMKKRNREGRQREEGGRLRERETETGGRRQRERWGR